MEDESTEQHLKSNIAMFMKSGKMVYEHGDYTSSVILYFKALFSISDLVILKNKGFIPKDHSERFRILEKDFPELYEIVDKHFFIYQNSYRTTVEKEDCDKIKENVERLAKKQKF